MTIDIAPSMTLPDDSDLAAEATGEMVFPCSAAQNRLWFINKLSPGNQALNIALRWELKGRFNPSTVEHAFQLVAERHEILRTAFSEQDGEPVQTVASRSNIKLSLVDLTAEREEKRLDRAMELAQEEALRPFDVGKLPLLRLTLLRLSADRAFLLVTAHHLIFDGTSIRLLAHEFGTIAAALAAGRSFQFPDLLLQYGDYCLWQKEYLASGAVDADAAYWKAKLAGLPYFEVEPDHARPTRPTSRGDIIARILAPATGGRLEQAARRHNMTLFSFGCGVTAAMLHRFTGRSQVTFGTQIAGRGDSDLENLIGLFINNLVLSFEVAGDPAFDDFLPRVKETVQDALVHQHLPFDKLVEVLNPPRDPKRAPLVSINFTVLNDSREPQTYGGFELSRQPSHSTGSLYDLNISLLRWPDGWRVALEFNPDLFEPSTAEQILKSLAAAFELAVSNPEAKLSSLAAPVRNGIKAPKSYGDPASDQMPRARPMDDGIRRPHRLEIVRSLDWQGFSRNATVDAYFTAAAKFAADAPAVLDGDTTASYRELDKRSNQLARHLQKLGAGHGDRIGLLAQRSLDTIVAILGILKAGSAFVPFDPGYPEDRLAFMMEDCAPVLTLAQPGLGVFSTLDRHPFVDMEAAIQAASSESDSEVARVHRGNNLAYVMYTSGSTGRPKGVLVPHRGITRLVKEQNYASFGPDECFLHVTPLAFDVSTFEIWGALLNGGRVGIIREPRPPPDAIGDAIARYGVTTAWFTSGLFHLLVDHHLECLRPLHRIVAGGDVLSPAHIKKALAGLPETQLVNGYGPTENTTFTCCYPIPREGWGGGSVPIGLPIAHTEIYLLGSGLELVKDGEAGQLSTGGDGLALGYLNRPELTEEKFVPNPFGKVPGERLYLTGDMARRRPDGLIEFLGRTDRQIKINGKRVELDEIENCLRDDPRVADAIVMLREDLDGNAGHDAGQKCIIAYLKPAQNQATGAFGDSVIAALRSKLPEHMIPADTVTLESFPLTPNGKVDRKRMPRPAAAPVMAEELSATELTVAEIWRDVLGAPKIGPNSNFFKLGGHSLLALRLIARVSSALGTKVDVAVLFEAPTLREFVARLSDPDAPKQPWNIVQIQPKGSKTPIIAINNTAVYYNLAREIGVDRPFVGLQLFDPAAPRQLDSRSLNEIAADYLRLLRAAQPHGPYVLFGLCVAGVIAYEMARQLRQAGELVPLVVMADSWPPGYLARLPRVRRQLLRLNYRINELFHRAGYGFVSVLRRKHSLPQYLATLGPVRKSGILRLAAWLRLIDVPSLEEPDLGNRWFLSHLQDARLKYEVPDTEGTVVVLRSGEAANYFASEDMGWAHVAKGRLCVHRIPGWHDQMFQGKGACLIAGHLRPFLEEADLAAR